MPHPHRHLEVELSLIVEGEIAFRHGGKPVRMRGPQLNLFWAMKEHQIVRPSERTTSYLLILPLSNFCALNIPAGLRGAVLNGSILQVSALAREDLDLSRLLFERWTRDLRGERRVGPGMAAELAALLTRPTLGREWTAVPDGAGDQQTCDDSLLQALIFVITHACQPLSLASVARAVGQHPETLARKFREALGTSMNTIVNDVRIAHSMRLLDGSAEKIATIAMECGFGSLSHFAEQFSKRNGMSPNRYRLRH